MLIRHLAQLSFFGLFAFAGPLLGTDLIPWTRVDLELYPKAEYQFEHYDRVDSSSHSEHHHDNANFVTLGIGTSYSVWSGEIETTVANTRRTSFFLDNVSVTGRYQLLDDILGDPVSLIAGITLTRATDVALHDISCFHHGQNELEAHIAIGKERPCRATWTSRGWGAFVYGIGDHGSPWMRAICAWEKNFGETLHARVFVKGCYGFGGNSLNPHHFRGYGPIRHRSVDLGARLLKISDCYGQFELEYAYRVYAVNFPKSASFLTLAYLYPFGL